jgi:hypothetical protein
MQNTCHVGRDGWSQHDRREPPKVKGTFLQSQGALLPVASRRARLASAGRARARDMRSAMQAGTESHRLALSFWLLFALGLSGASAARAEPPPNLASAQAPTARAFESEPTISYEQQRVNRVLAEQTLDLEPMPQGKRIAFVQIVREDVFVRDEIWPLWPNWFHGRTAEPVVRRELLFAPGSHYDDASIEETMRNLRGMGIFALVRIVAVKARHPDEVGVLVFTRDLWSLRLETDLNATNKLSSFTLRGVERNAFGRDKAVSAEYLLSPKSYQITQGYEARRVLLSSVALSQSAGLVFERDSNQVEGAVGSASLGQPFYSLSQQFSWIAAFARDRRVQRNIRDGDVLFYPAPETFPQRAHARQAYFSRVERGYLTGSFRHGTRTKNTFALGWDYRSRVARVIAETELPDWLDGRFQRALFGTLRTDNGPALSYQFFVPRWVTFENLASYGMSENVRVGPRGLISSRVPLEGAGSTATAWVPYSEVGWSLTPHDFLLDLLATGTARLERQRWIDQKVTLMMRGATPVLGAFRLVMRAYWEIRRRDSQATLVTLGGDNGLRGHVNSQLYGYGADRLLANFELRTLPIAWEAVHVGGVLFYDVGSVFADASELRLHHAAGIGVRLLFPQFNRMPFSFDGGASFDPGFRFVPTINAGQVVPLTAAEDPT